MGFDTVPQYQQGTKKRMSGSKNPGPAPTHEELEEEMEMWVKDMRKKAKKVTRHLVLREVMEKYPVLCGGVGAPDFWKKVLGWYQRFCRRKNLVRLAVTSKGRKLPRGWESIWREAVKRCQTLRAKVQRLLDPTQNGTLLGPGRIGNMDQTPVWLEPIGQLVLWLSVRVCVCCRQPYIGCERY